MHFYSESFEQRTPRRKSAFRVKQEIPVDLNSSISNRPPAPLPRESLDSATDEQQKDLHGATQHCTRQSPLETAVDTTVEQTYDIVQVHRPWPAAKEFKGNVYISSVKASNQIYVQHQPNQKSLFDTQLYLYVYMNIDFNASN